ncbi:MAG: TIGR00299 family protein [candidate division Zixibacteria bacterium RBG_16_48_11]|nr:MAG: TIGR00299 family protein [candidate division Zixibacteria bacterium RBG_16_48_11]
MKIAYFDCFAGISGDMILGALLDCGLDTSHWKKELSKLSLSGYELEITKTTKLHISATKVNVKVKESSHHRKLSDIISLIGKSGLDNQVREKSIGVFNRLGRAEAKIHGKKVEEVHFHEVGAVDAIVDVVGSVLGLKLLGIEEVFASQLPLTKGFVKTEHGDFPIPAPATIELLSGWPVKNRDLEAELVTPTGAAIITTIAKYSQDLEFIPKETGYGAGDKDFKEFPNVLRVTIGEKVSHYEQDEVVVLETNIDNTEPQVLGYLIERLLASGAKDVSYTPVTMKKNRPGVLLTVLANPQDAQLLSQIVFAETNTSGIRHRRESRSKLPRRVEEVDTIFGKARVKLAGENSNLQILPEFEDCKILAQKNNLPFKIVYEKIREAYLTQMKEKR